LNTVVSQSTSTSLLIKQREQPRIRQLPAQQGVQKKTLVLDLDETLIHSKFFRNDKADFSFPVQFTTTIDQYRITDIQCLCTETTRS